MGLGGVSVTKRAVDERGCGTGREAAVSVCEGLRRPHHRILCNRSQPEQTFYRENCVGNSARMVLQGEAVIRSVIFD